MRLKVLCCCGAGMGTCMMMKAKVDKALSDLGWSGRVDCESVAIAKTIWKGYDVVFVNHNLVSNFNDPNQTTTAVLGLTNVLDVNEMKEKLTSNEMVSEKANK